MKKHDKLYIIFSMLFLSFLILGNIIYQKFIKINVFSIHMFELSAGAVLYPITFILTDLITEFFGKEKARFCVNSAVFINILIASIIALIDYIPATSWSKITDANFHQVFGNYNIAVIGSIMACYISQNIDIYLYIFIKKLTNNKYLWLRNLLSSSISLFVDTVIVINFLSIFSILPNDKIWFVIFNSYSWKLFFILFSTPLLYIFYSIIRFYIDKDKIS